MADKPPAYIPLPMPRIGGDAPATASAADTRSTLQTLTPAEEAKLRDSFGVAVVEPAAEEVGQDYETTLARIREIEARALAKLRDPKRLARLAAFDEAAGSEDDEDDED